MGYDVKCTSKKILITPGPSSYAAEVDVCRTVSHNYKLNNGGLKKPEPTTHKESLIAKSLGIRSYSSARIGKNTRILA